MQRLSGPKLILEETCNKTLACSYSGIQSIEHTLNVAPRSRTVRRNYGQQL